MYGYLRWDPEGRPRVALHPETIGGAAFLTLEARGGEKRLNRRIARAAAAMERAGVRRCVVPENWPSAWLSGLQPVGEAELRRAVFPRLLERFCREWDLETRAAATLLSAPTVDRSVWEAADLLARRSRYLILSVENSEALRRDLLRRYGLAVLPPGRRPVMQVCFREPAEDVPALLLGEDCGSRQRVTYRLPQRLEEGLAGYEISSQLVAALWHSGILRTEEIGVKSLGFHA